MDYTNNAINDIFYGGSNGMDRFQGAISQISWVTNIFDRILVWTMSLVGYFVIGISLFRTAVTLLYVSNPTFFDTLAEAKESVRSKSSGKSVGWLFHLAAFFIPDVKSVTHIPGEEDKLDNPQIKKTLFLRVCIQATACIIAGALIYNGDYRDLVAKITDGGSFLLHEYVLSVDPKKLITEIAESGKQYEFNYPQTAEGKRMKQIAESSYDALLGYYTDMKSEENRWTVGANVENWVNSEVLNMKVPFGSATNLRDAIKASKEYNIKVSASIVPTTTDLTLQESDNSIQQTFFKPASAFGYTPSNMSPAEDKSFVRLTVLVQSKEYIQNSSTVSNKLGKVKVTGTVYQDGKSGSSKTRYIVTIPSLANGDGMPDTIKIGSTIYEKGQASATDSYISYVSVDAPNESNRLPSVGQTSEIGVSGFTIGGFEAGLTLTGVDSASKNQGDIQFIGQSWKGEPLSKFQEAVNEATNMSNKSEAMSGSKNTSEDKQNNSSEDLRNLIE